MQSKRKFVLNVITQIHADDNSAWHNWASLNIQNVVNICGDNPDWLFCFRQLGLFGVFVAFTD